MHVTSRAEIIRPNNTTAYAAGDEVQSAVPAVIEFQNCGWSGETTGRICSAQIYKSGTSVTNTAFRLYLFSASVSPGSDNSPLNVSYADLLRFIGAIDAPLMQRDGASGAPQITMEGSGLGYPFKTGKGTASLFGRLVSEGAWTPDALEKLTIVIGVERD